MKQIFISYAQSDADSAAQMYNILKQAGLNPWLALSYQQTLMEKITSPQIANLVVNKSPGSFRFRKKMSFSTVSIPKTITPRTALPRPAICWIAYPKRKNG
jgi:hypothetical protein